MDQHIIIGSRVRIGPHAIIGVFVAIGVENSDQATTIGDHATIRSHTVIYGGSRIGNYFHAGHGVLIRQDVTIGDQVSVGSHSVIEHNITIGNNVRIHSLAFVSEYSVLKDDCWIGPAAVLINAKYPRSPRVKQQLHGPVIGSKARIGAGAVILPGVTVGDEALVGAGSVVTQDVAKRSVVAGNPARVINSLDNLPYA